MDLFLGFRGCGFKGSLKIQMCKFDLMTMQGRSIEFNCYMVISFFRLHSLKKKSDLSSRLMSYIQRIFRGSWKTEDQKI